MGYSKYPGQIDGSNQLPPAVDGRTPVIAEVVNRLRDAVIAVETELGVQPSATFGSVRARLDDMTNELRAMTFGIWTIGMPGATITCLGSLHINENLNVDGRLVVRGPSILEDIILLPNGGLGRTITIRDPDGVFIGDSLSITAGKGATDDGTGPFNGGDINLTAGRGGKAALGGVPGFGGDINIIGGQGGARTGGGPGADGGTVIIDGGPATLGGANGAIMIGNTYAPAISLGSAITNTTITQLGLGQVLFTGNVDAALGVDVTGGPFTFNGTLGSWTMALATSALTQTGIGQVTFTGNTDAQLGLDVSGADFSFTGTLGSWTIALADSALTQTGAGQVTFTGNTDATLGLDVSGADFTYTGAVGSWTIGLAASALTQTGIGQVTFTGNVDAQLGLDVSGAQFSFTGTAGSWIMALADSALTQTGAGLVTFTGHLLMSSSSDIRYGAAVVLPTIYQMTDTVGAAGDTLRIRAQDCTADPSVGGTLALEAGDGFTTDGTVDICTSDAAARFRIGTTGIDFPTNLAITASGGPTWGMGTGLVTSSNGILINVATGYLAIGSVAPGGGGGSGVNVRASVGRLRLPYADANGGVVFRNKVDNADVAGISVQTIVVDDCLFVGGAYPSRPGSVYVDATSYTRLATGGVSRLLATSAIIQISVVDLLFGAAVVSPKIGHETDATAGVTGDDLVVAAQDVNDPAGGATAGDLGLRGGQGTVHANNKDGNVWFHVAPAAWQSMEKGIFIGNVITAPSAVLAAGTAMWSDATDFNILPPNGGIVGPISTAFIGLGAAPGSGGGSGVGIRASAGVVRLSNLPANGGITSRNATDADDVSCLHVNGSNRLCLGIAAGTADVPDTTQINATSTVYVGCGGAGTIAVTTAAVQIAVIIEPSADIRFTMAAPSPTVYQNTETGNAVQADDLTIAAQGVSEATGGANTSWSGHLGLRGGRATGAASNTDGNVWFHASPGALGTWQSMEKGVFIGACVAAPTAALASGAALWSDATDFNIFPPNGGLLLPYAAGYIGVGTVPTVGGLAGERAIAGFLRTPYGNVLSCHGGGGAFDLPIIATGASNYIVFGNSSGPSYINGVNLTFRVSNVDQFVVTASSWAFVAALVLPVIGQAAPAVDIAATNLTIRAQAAGAASGAIGKAGGILYEYGGTGGAGTAALAAGAGGAIYLQAGSAGAALAGGGANGGATYVVGGTATGLLTAGSAYVRGGDRAAGGVYGNVYIGDLNSVIIQIGGTATASTHNYYVGNGGNFYFKNASYNPLSIYAPAGTADGIVKIGTTTLRFETAIAAPIITQEVEAGIATTADDLIVSAQGVNEAAGGGSASWSGDLGLRGGVADGHADNHDGNVWFHVVPASWQTMEKGIFVANCVVAPTGDPASGGFLYSLAGALTWRGSGGTTTTIGPAEPHCPRCGRDCAHEWQNNKNGWKLTICMWCLTDALGDVGVIIKEQN